MPNWVKTRIIGADMEALKKAILTVDENGVETVDFNKVIPMPKDLSPENMVCGSVSYAAPSKIFSSSIKDSNVLKQQPVTMRMKQILGHFIRENDRRPNQAEFVKVALEDKYLTKMICELKGWKKSKDTGVPSYIDTFIKGFFNYETYGFVDWYEWSVINWGCKWNAGDTMVDETGIYFETPWSVAEPILRKLAEITPIRVQYADEALGSNCGLADVFINEDGEAEIKIIMEESTELAAELWGYGHIPVYDEETYEYIEDEEDERFKQANEHYQEVVDEIDELMQVEQLQKDFELIEE